MWNKIKNKHDIIKNFLLGKEKVILGFVALELLLFFIHINYLKYVDNIKNINIVILGIILPLLNLYIWWCINKKYIPVQNDTKNIPLLKVGIRVMARIYLGIGGILFIQAVNYLCNLKINDGLIDLLTYTVGVVMLFYIIIDFINTSINKNINILYYIILGAILLNYKESEFIIPFILFGIYYFINWISSVDFVYYILGEGQQFDKNRVTTDVKKRWSKQKGLALYIVISLNIVFAIKKMLPVEFKEFIIEMWIYLVSLIQRGYNFIYSLLGLSLAENSTQNRDIYITISLLVATLVLYKLLEYFSKRKINPPFLIDMVEEQYKLVEKMNNTSNKIKRIKKSKKK